MSVNTSSYYFNNMGRIGADTTDNTEQTVSNTRFANYMLSNYFSENLSGQYVSFATQQPTINFNGVAHGSGLNSGVIDNDSLLLIEVENERPVDKLQLHERPFLSVPYMGRGSCNVNLESQLQQGEIVGDKKSISTVSEKSLASYIIYPNDEKMVERANNASYTVEEYALDGWVRGGANSREMAEKK